MPRDPRPSLPWRLFALPVLPAAAHCVTASCDSFSLDNLCDPSCRHGRCSWTVGLPATLCSRTTDSRATVWTAGRLPVELQPALRDEFQMSHNLCCRTTSRRVAI
eukprot:363500-Chlamydomonas_euryale.AAC.11